MPTPRGRAAEAAGSNVATRACRRRRRGGPDIGLHPSCTCEQYRIGAGWGSRAVARGLETMGVRRVAALNWPVTANWDGVTEGERPASRNAPVTLRCTAARRRRK